MSVISLISPRLFVSASLQPSPSYLLGFSSRHHFSPHLTAVLCFVQVFLEILIALWTVSDVWLPVNTLHQFSASFRHVPLSLLYFLLSLSLCLFLCFGCASLLDKHGFSVLWLADPHRTERGLSPGIQTPVVTLARQLDGGKMSCHYFFIFTDIK